MFRRNFGILLLLCLIASIECSAPAGAGGVPPNQQPQGADQPTIPTTPSTTPPTTTTKATTPSATPSATTAATTIPTTTPYPGCSEDDKAGADTAAIIALAVIATFQILFSICVAVAFFMIIQKLGEKIRESETHLHQVMDATLCALFPQSVVQEINSVAEEAQNQNKKPKENSKREENKEKTKDKSAAKSGKSPAQPKE